MAFNPTQPKYSGDGVSVWIGVVENGQNKGKEFLKVRVLGGKSINCFLVEQKREE